jgi:branched-chain amino acid transport system substrate-binding protein
VPDPRLVPAAREAIATYNKQGIDPEGYVLYSYATVQVWAEAAKRAGDTQGALIADTLRSGTFAANAPGSGR